MLISLNKINFVFFLIWNFLAIGVFGQEVHYFNKIDSSQKRTLTQSVFNEIELGISSSRASAISSYLSKQTYFSLTNGVNGYYSSNQAIYLLEDFFKAYKVISFKMQNVNLDENIPYATGVYHYDFRGKRGIARVYISLTKSGNHWKISLLTIN
ncbi:MAG: DUF4783 domain-containing protein [Ignavibacteriaceae bacterium]|nr:DUF4783 domain-containing protein [Ignavibacteriaceae bacterium]